MRSFNDWLQRRSTKLTRRVGSCLLAALLLGLLSACQTLQPAPETQAQTKLLPGKFVWFALLTPDAQQAEKFYGGLFGWEFSRQQTQTSIRNAGEEIGAIFQLPAEEQLSARWIGSLSVTDVAMAVEMTRTAGGKVHEGPGKMPEGGEYAIISDPQGAVLAVQRAQHGDPPDRTPSIGSWLWHELWTDNLSGAVEFYQRLGQYQVLSLKKGRTPYVILGRDEQWRAGVVKLFEEQAEDLWLPSIRVADSQQAAVKAAQLGGEVLVPPGALPGDGGVTVIRDPAGAIFMVEAWTAEGGEK